MKNKIGSSKSMKKMQKGGTMSSLDSMKYYGNKYDSLSAEAAKKIGTKVSPNKDIKEAGKARANETRLGKKIYGTGPGIPQKKKGGSVKKYQAGGTPFQGYVAKYPGNASDTTARTDPRYNFTNSGYAGQNAQKNADLKTAFTKTYGDKDMTGVDQEDEAKSRIIPKNKKGGSVKKYQIGGAQTPFEYRVNGPKVGPIQVKSYNVPGAQEARRTADFNTEQGDINRAQRASDRREITRSNTPVEKGSSIARPLTNSINNFVRSEMKKGGSVGSSKKLKMAKGGSVSFGMLSVKKGIDKNPKPTAADRIAGATMKKGGMVKKSSKKK
jgi:hypothetical protein